VDAFNRPTSEKFQLLAVAQPSALGQTPLPGTLKELEKIQQHAGSFKVSSLSQSEATVQSVMAGMKESCWAHFACHGVQDITNPIESGLLLAGASRLKLSDIISLSISHADLAFLSACQTAMGVEDLPGEAVHLAAGMLLAGYRGVIATMWSIMDRDAPQVAGDVYAHLFKGHPDHTQAAHALHYAVQRLREDAEGRSFLSWVPFIHIGV
jgi:CHAT domain-containing protein